MKKQEFLNKLYFHTILLTHLRKAQLSHILIKDKAILFIYKDKSFVMKSPSITHSKKSGKTKHAIFKKIYKEKKRKGLYLHTPLTVYPTSK